MQPIIKIENLSKQYRLGVVGTGTLSNDLKRWWHRMRGKEDPFLKVGETNERSVKGASQYVWALRDINLEVMPGEVLGIIGKNGAGKSTLLKILSKVTGPTTGSIHYNGRIGSLLEVGTGFHPELTGRENIFLNGAILGMTKAEIRSKLDEIIDFSGVARYIDTPVKRYSSGMMVRLGFAVAAHLEPEILVVDEVLAVGDAEFQKKAVGKMQDVSRQEGRTVLFVSHNMNSIKRLCNKGLLLKDGFVDFSGDINETVKNYLTLFYKEGIVSEIKYDKNEKEIQILEAKLVDKNGCLLNNAVSVLTDFYLGIKYKFKKDISGVHLTFLVGNENGEIILFCDRVDTYTHYAKVEKGIYETLIKFPNPLLLPGKYSITLGCASTESWIDDHKFDVLSFEISEIDSSRIHKRDGFVFQPVKWELIKID